jgi:hypothetical protein
MKRKSLVLLIGIFVLTSITQAQIYYQYNQNDPLNLQQIVDAMSDPNDPFYIIYEGIEVNYPYDGELIITPEFTFWNARTIYASSEFIQIAQNVRLLGGSTTYYELTFEGGLIGTEFYQDSQDLENLGLPIVYIDRYPSRFVNTVIERGSLKMDNGSGVCDLYGDIDLVVINGVSTTSFDDVSATEFTYDIQKTVDFVGVNFRDANDVVPDLCIGDVFHESPVKVNSARARFSDVEFTDWLGVVYDAGAIEANTSLVHVEDCTIEGLNTSSKSALLNVTGGLELNGIPNVYMADCNVTFCEGEESGVVSLREVDECLLSNNVFTSNTGSYAGTLFDYDSDNVRVENSQFVSNVCSGVDIQHSYYGYCGGAAFMYYGNAIPSSEDELHGFFNCEFYDNTASLSAIDVGAISFKSGNANVFGCSFDSNNSLCALRAKNPSERTVLKVGDCEFTGEFRCIDFEAWGHQLNRVSNCKFTESFSPLLAIILDDPQNSLGFTIDGILSKDCSYGLMFATAEDVEIYNSILWNTAASSEVAIGSQSGSFTISHCNIRGGQSSVVGGTPTFVDLHTDTPVLTSEDELVWNSVLVDEGVGTGSGSDELLDYDFDLTNRDIGWHKPRDIVTLTGSVSGLESKWYKADGQVSIDVGSTGIPAGTVVRAESYADVIIHSHGAQSLDIGSAAGTRTAIVGQPDRDLDPADLIQLDGDHLVGSDLSMQGLLFNYAPSMSDIGDLDVAVPALDFLNVDFLELNGDLSTALNTVEFQKYDNAMLAFSGCEGWIRNWNLSEQQPNDELPDFIGLVSSLVHVENVQFQLSNASDHPFALKYVGSYEGGTEALVSLSDFPKTFGGPGYEPLQIEQAFVRLEDNTFESDGAASMYQFQSATYMNEWGGNTFSATSFQTEPLIDVSSGCVDMFCGGNSFIWQSASSGNPAIAYDTNNPMPAMVPEWSFNWWGSTCTSEWDEEDLNDPALGLIPEWAWVTNSLSSCTGAPPVGCDTDLSDTAWLLAQGKIAEQGDFRHVAHEYYRTIVLEHPKAKEVVEATGRLKTIGQKGDFGADYYEFVRDDLFDAADESEAVLYHLNAVQQDCNGWLVEAYTGDCITANNALLAMLVGETDPKCIAVINAALTERSTYANCGGLLAMNETGLLAQPIARAKATRQLLLGRATSASEAAETVLPSAFKIESCFPNPFNPVTTVRFTVPTQSHVLVRAFNLQGQLVATLQDGRLESGIHNVQFNGSSLASGLYLIQAEAAGVQDVQKVMLVK